MRYLDKDAIEDIALGASFFGAGGGGNPYMGKLMAMQAVDEFGPVKLLEPDETDDEDWYCPVAIMGAPAVMMEKFPKGDEFGRVLDKLEAYTGHHFTGTFPMEAGGVNSMVPLTLAATRQIPLVDCDGMGRAFPELQMCTFHLGGVSTTPMAITDEKGNAGVIETISAKWAERLARVQTVEMGGSATVSLYPANGKQIKQNGISGIVTQCQQVGQSIRLAHNDPETALKNLLDATDGHFIFEGKVTDLLRTTKGGFNVGDIHIAGFNNFQESELVVTIQNENLFAARDSKPVTMAPDLIIILDAETLTPITTEMIKYGKRVKVVATPANDKWRTKAGIEVAGPRYFGFDYDYVPVEELLKED